MDLQMMELDEKTTRTKSRKVLKQYKQLERMAGKSSVLRSPQLKDMPRRQFKPDVMEERLIRQMDAERECREILEAVMSLGPREQKVIKLAYTSDCRYTNFEIGQQLNYSYKTIELWRSNALIQFAYAYKNGELLVWKN